MIGDATGVKSFFCVEYRGPLRKRSKSVSFPCAWWCCRRSRSLRRRVSTTLIGDSPRWKGSRGKIEAAVASIVTFDRAA